MAFSFRRWFTRAEPRSEELTTPQVSPGEPAEAEAQFLKGLAFASGQGAGQNFSQAAHWYGKAAEQNHSSAQLNLAVLLGQGEGVAKDEAKALMWLTRAAKLGNAVAQYRLGVRQYQACREGRTGATTEGRVEALKWLWLSAAQGCLGAVNAREFMSLSMTRDEVAEGMRRATGFVAG